MGAAEADLLSPLRKYNSFVLELKSKELPGDISHTSLFQKLPGLIQRLGNRREGHETHCEGESFHDRHFESIEVVDGLRRSPVLDSLEYR